MGALFGLIGLASMVALVVGMFSPRKVIRWGSEEKKMRGRVLLVYGAVMLLSFGIVGATQESPPASKQTKAEPVKVEQKVKEKQAEPAKPAAPPAVNWNAKELDVKKNGNIQLAVRQLKSVGDITQQAARPQPGDVAKTPWKHYGKICRFEGEAVVVQDYPPGGDVAKLLGGDAGEIVLVADDDTIVDFLVAGSTGSVRKGDRVAVYGYPVGLAEVSNQLGGKTTQLVVVGNAFNR